MAKSKIQKNTSNKRPNKTANQQNLLSFMKKSNDTANEPQINSAQEPQTKYERANAKQDELRDQAKQFNDKIHRMQEVSVVIQCANELVDELEDLVLKIDEEIIASDYGPGESDHHHLDLAMESSNSI